MSDGPFDIEKLLSVEGLDLRGLNDLGKPSETGAKTRFFRGWTEEGSSYLSDGEYERFVLRNGDGAGRLDGRITKEFGILDWDADIPKELKPGQSLDDFYDRFLPLIATWLPNKMMLGLNTLEQTTLRYRKSSQIVLETPERVVETYKIDTEKETAKLAFRFTKAGDRIARMRIVAGLGLSDYTLDLSYGRGLVRDRMELRLPVNQRGVRAFTDSTTEWILSTNREKDSLGSNIAVAAAHLAEIMEGKMTNALVKKEQRGMG